MACVAVMVSHGSRTLRCCWHARRPAGATRACARCRFRRGGARPLSVYAALVVGLKEGEADVEASAGVLFGVVGIGWALALAWQLYARFVRAPRSDEAVPLALASRVAAALSFAACGAWRITCNYVRLERVRAV